MASHGKHTKNPGYDEGNNWVVCDRCGMDMYASEARHTWDGLLVCPEDYEPRHDQDFVRSRKDKITADVVRPDPEPVEIEVTYSAGGADDTIPPGTFNEDTL